MEIFVGIALVLMFIAGRKSAGDRKAVKVINLTPYRMDVTYSQEDGILTVHEVMLDE